MTTQIINGQTLLEAEEGFFLKHKTNENLYGLGMWLGINDSADNYDELPIDQMPEPEPMPEFEEPVVGE